MNPTNIKFEERYSDDSGVEYGVEYDVNKGNPQVKITATGEDITLPVSRIEWLSDCLSEIRSIERSRERLLEAEQKQKEKID